MTDLRLRRLLLAAGMLLVVLALPVTLARLSGLDSWTPTVQLVGLAPLATGLLVAAVVLLVVLLLVVLLPAVPGRGATTPGRRDRRSVRVPLVALLVASALVALHLSWLLPGPPTRPVAAGTVVTVLSVNARFGGADAERVVDLVRERDVDVLTVQELTADLADDLDRAGLGDLLPHAVRVERPGPAGAGTWSRWPQRELPAPPTTFTTLRSVVTVPGPVGALTVTNVHTWPPLPGTVQRWRADLAAVTALAADTDGPHVLAGDLNATPDHSRFRALVGTGLVDTAAGRGQVWRPTWPSDQPWPPFLALDHVLVDAGITARTVERVEVAGTDHLAVLAVIDAGPPPGPIGQRPSAPASAPIEVGAP